MHSINTGNTLKGTTNTTNQSPRATIIICEGDTKLFTVNGIWLCVPPKL